VSSTTTTVSTISSDVVKLMTPAPACR
jgi:hypothetical protein